MKKSDIHRILRKIVHSPRFQLVAGVTLLFMTLFGSFFQPHHGFLLIGGYWVVQAIASILQALERIEKGIDD